MNIYVIAGELSATIGEWKDVDIMNEQKLLDRITINSSIFGGKPIIRGRRLAVEHILGMLAAGDSSGDILEAYDWLEEDDIQACLVLKEGD